MTRGKGHLCGVCNATIPKTVYKIQCGNCQRYHHPLCVRLSEAEARVMYEQKVSWSCDKCSLGHTSQASTEFTLSNQDRRNSIYQQNSDVVTSLGTGQGGRIGDRFALTSHNRRLTMHQEKNDDDETLRSIILDLRTEVRSLKDDVFSIKESLDFVNSMYESQKKTTKVLADMIDEIKKENISLRADVTTLRNKLHGIETEKNGKKLLINGAYSMTDNDNIIKMKTLKVLKFVTGDAVTESCLESLRIIKPKTNNPPLVSLSFKDENMTANLLKLRKEKGTVDTTKCEIDDNARSIYLNEELNKEVYTLLREAKKCKGNGYRYVWCKNGNVFVKKDDNHQAIKVRDNDHIQLLLGAVQNK